MRDGVWWDKTRVMTREDKYAWRLRVKRSIMRAHERLHREGGFHISQDGASMVAALRGRSEWRLRRS